MKQIKFTAVALAAIVTVSCEKTPGGEQPDNKPANVAIRIELPGARTRAIGTPISGNATVANLESGHVFIYNSTTGVINKHLYIGASASAPTGVDMIVSFADIMDEEDTNHVVVTNVSPEANMAMVVLNDNGVITQSKTNRTISEVKKTATTAVKFNAASTVDKVTLTDDKALTATGGTDGGADDQTAYTKSAVLQAAAIGTRAQLKKVTAEQVGDIVVTGFDVEGVFVNYVYKDMNLDGTRVDDGNATLTAALDVDNGSTEANYGATNYGTGTAGETLADYAASYSATTGVAVPGTATKAWVYNLVPSAGVPHLLVKVNNIAYTIGGVAQTTITTPKWITVRNYYEGGSEQPIAAFLPNNSYTIDNLNFNFNDLTEDPETELANTRVYVTIAPWIDHTVTWKP